MKKLILIGFAATMCAAPAAAAPPTITLRAAPTVLSYGGATTLSGTLSTDKAGEAVTVEAQECAQGAFKSVATATTTSGGGFSAAVKPTMTTIYQAKRKGASSTTATVRVAPLVAVKKLSLGKFKVTVTGAQSFVGKYVVFQRLRKTKWVTLKKVTLTTVATTTAPTQLSAATFRIKLPARLRVRAVLPLTQVGTCYLAAQSKPARS